MVEWDLFGIAVSLVYPVDHFAFPAVVDRNYSVEGRWQVYLAAGQSEVMGSEQERAVGVAVRVARGFQSSGSPVVGE